MGEEYGDFDILEFACGGAKQYGLKLRNKRTGEIEYVLKIRGITFDVENEQALQFETFREMVLHYGEEIDAAFFRYPNDFG